MTDDRRKQAKPARQDRVRYEVYGMPVEDIIADALASDQAPQPTAAQPEPEPAWPSLDELKAGGPRRRGGRRRG